MKKYETVFISDPDLQDQARVDLLDKVRNIIAQENGVFLNFDEWGNKKLAYEINKKLRGHYVCVTYGGTGELIKELERNFRLSDDVMKFMTILLSDDVTAEQLEKEAQETQEAENQSKQVDETEKKSVEEKTVEKKTDKEPVEEKPVEEETSKEDEKVEETEKETESLSSEDNDNV
ncbi:MAG: 30S ribosomal protein S6 [Desulfobacterales bacterium]|nr:30S ribosomal protein S6 [Desulfobacterales bacterium]MBU8909952.1 30S ribosomal protein S6 [Desulfobacterales bacterium]